MFEIDLYEEYVCTKCNRCSELCNCNDNDKEIKSEGEIGYDV